MSRLSSGFSAFSIAVLTVGVFWVLRSIGPESVLRQFHQAALNGDRPLLSRTLTPESSAGSVDFLAGRVVEYGREGGRFRLSGIDRRGKFAVADVSYVFPNRGLVVSTLWVLEQRSGKWLINADETASMRPRLQGVPPVAPERSESTNSPAGVSSG
jgi:hypothetical protein